MCVCGGSWIKETTHRIPKILNYLLLKLVLSQIVIYGKLPRAFPVVTNASQTCYLCGFLPEILFDRRTTQPPVYNSIAFIQLYFE